MGSVASIVLIGMPGVGKSTVGVLLAKASNRRFIDTDLLIQAGEGRRLQELLDEVGRARFCAIEADYVRDFDYEQSVVATGGSVVYSDAAMRHLKSQGVVVHLWLPRDALERRLANLPDRGVVMAPGQGIAELYAERMPLYERYEDRRIDCRGLDHEQTVQAILQAIG